MSHQVLVSRHTYQTIPALGTKRLEEVQQRLSLEKNQVSLQHRVGDKRVGGISFLHMIERI